MTRRDLFSLAAAPLALGAAQGKKQKVLYFTRSAGYEHSVVKRQGSALSHSEKCMIELGRRANFDVECTKDGRVFDGDLDQYDVIAFYTSAVLTEPGGDGSPPMTPAGKKKFLDAIAGGKGFFGFHACTDSFHSKGGQYENQTEIDPYIAMVGGEFIVHGPQQEGPLILTSRFPGAGNLGIGEGIALYDEWYTFKNFAKDLHVILVQETEKMKGDCYRRPNFPSTWARMHGKGRVFYTALAHREDVWLNPFFEAVVLGGFRWTLGRVDFDIAPNIDKVTPQASILKS